MRSITYREALKLASDKGIYPARGATGERTFHYTKDKVEYTVSFQDAESIRIKIELAKKLGVKGVAIFKIDERADQDYWKHVK
jgi:spore germination protein YaaH